MNIKQIFAKSLRTLLCCVSAILLFGCFSSPKENVRMDRAESLMESAPDSAMTILDSISLGSLSSQKDKARYALLKSMALDKNYIDATTFDQLQPAIDYYLKKGSPDEKLRTLYYQGRIYQNRKEDEEAMECFIKASDQKDMITDSLTLAKMLYTKSRIYYNTHRYESYVRTALEAAHLFGEKGDNESKQLCLIYAMDGSVIIENKHKADSILTEYKALPIISTLWDSQWRHALIIYAYEFLSEKESLRIMDSISRLPYDENIGMDLAIGYAKVGAKDKALKYLSGLNEDSITNSSRYNSIRAEVLHEIGQDSDAYESILKYQDSWEKEMGELLSADILFLDKKYQLEKKNIEEREHRNRMWFVFIVIFLLLAVVLLFISLRLRTSELNRLRIEKRKRELEEDNKKLEEEKAHEVSEKNKIVNEKNSIEVERDRIESERNDFKKAYESSCENNLLLSTQLKELISEKDHLNSLIEGNTIISDEIVELVKDRLKILDELIASQISMNEKSTKRAMAILKQRILNREEFLKSTRLLYETLYPSFLKYLYENDLNDQEIDYICLQALGLRSKEIGAFLNTSRHYHISSSIRAKLGLTQNDTNLGIFIYSKFK